MFYLLPAGTSVAVSDVQMMALLPDPVAYRHWGSGLDGGGVLSDASRFTLVHALVSDAQHLAMIEAYPQPTKWWGSTIEAKEILAYNKLLHWWPLFAASHAKAMESVSRSTSKFYAHLMFSDGVNPHFGLSARIMPGADWGGQLDAYAIKQVAQRCPNLWFSWVLGALYGDAGYPAGVDAYAGTAIPIAPMDWPHARSRLATDLITSFVAFFAPIVQAQKAAGGEVVIYVGPPGTDTDEDTQSWWQALRACGFTISMDSAGVLTRDSNPRMHAMIDELIANGMRPILEPNPQITDINGYNIRDQTRLDDCDFISDYSRAGLAYSDQINWGVAPAPGRNCVLLDNAIYTVAATRITTSETWIDRGWVVLVPVFVEVDLGFETPHVNNLTKAQLDALVARGT